MRSISLIAVVASTGLSGVGSAAAQSEDPGASTAPAVPPETAGEHPATPTCNEQTPFDFMVRSNYVRRSGASEEERAIRRARHEQHIRYRTEQYGYFEGFGEPEWNDSTPAENAEYTEFFGERVRLNRRILPALACVEVEIRRTCADTPYQPSRLSGLRTRNTFRGGEVSNHVFGIAIDIDPRHNTCCGCVGEWAEHPLCQIEVDSIFERMAMPECWVHAFERYGFYWLGHDALQDTMHFEFLSDPDRILPPPPATPTVEGDSDVPTSLEGPATP